MKRARQAGKPREQTPWSLLPVESQPCRGREEPVPAREVDVLADGDGGGRVTCIPWKSLMQPEFVVHRGRKVKENFEERRWSG